MLINKGNVPLIMIPSPSVCSFLICLFKLLIRRKKNIFSFSHRESNQSNSSNIRPSTDPVSQRTREPGSDFHSQERGLEGFCSCDFHRNVPCKPETIITRIHLSGEAPLTEIKFTKCFRKKDL